MWTIVSLSPVTSSVMLLVTLSRGYDSKCRVSNRLIESNTTNTRCPVLSTRVVPASFVTSIVSMSGMSHRAVVISNARSSCPGFGRRAANTNSKIEPGKTTSRSVVASLVDQSRGLELLQRPLSTRGWPGRVPRMPL